MLALSIRSSYDFGTKAGFPDTDMAKNSVTIYDIARRANVSHVTVSNALRGLDGEVSKLQAIRIRKLADQMGYVANLTARSLVLGKTHTIVLITVAGLRHPYVHELIEKLQAELSLHQYHLNLEQTPDLQDMAAVVRTLSRGRCDGVISMLGHFSQNELGKIRNNGLPVVAIDPSPDFPFDCVDYDRTEALRLATSHLLDQECRRIALILGHDHGLTYDLFKQGYRTAMEAAGLPFDDSLIFEWIVGDDPSKLWQAIKASQIPFDGIISFNDQLMIGLLHAIRMDGRRVPEDLALVTLGNSWLIDLAEVPLTAVDMNRSEISRKAVECLLEQIRNPIISPRHQLVKPQLVIRASSNRLAPAES